MAPDRINPSTLKKKQHVKTNEKNLLDISTCACPNIQRAMYLFIPYTL